MCKSYFLYDRSIYSNDLVKFFGCDVQHEKNWEFMMYIQCYIGNGKIAKKNLMVSHKMFDCTT